VARFPSSILVVDDHEALRTVLSAVLTRRGYRVFGVGSGEEVLSAVQRERPDLVLLDVHLPGISGYEVFRELRAQFGERLPIVFISGERIEPYDRVAGLRLGADDYIVKPFAPDELVARVDRLIEQAARESNREPLEAVAFGLTRRELEVLRLLADGASPREVARALFISEKTVSSHIQNILVKLDVHTQAQAVSVAFTAGLVDLRGRASMH